MSDIELRPWRPTGRDNYLSSGRSEALLEQTSILQLPPRSKSAGNNREISKDPPEIVYPALSHGVDPFEQDAWMQDGEQTDHQPHTSSVNDDLIKSHPNLRTTPLIITPLPEARPRSATPWLGTQNKVVPVITTIHNKEFARSNSPDIWVSNSESSLICHQERKAPPTSLSVQYNDISPSSSARWRHNRVHPSPSNSETSSPVHRAVSPVFTVDTAKRANQPTMAVEEATGEVVHRRELGEGSADTLQRSHSAQQSSLDVVSHVSYIPFHCAEQALNVVVEDMKSMKSQHVEIVHQILNAYKDIEQESKIQYQGFVERLREQHTSKVGAYKEVVRVLQEELNNMRTHWESTVKSVNLQNRELLEENKVLYQKVKEVLEKAEMEKERTTVYYTKRLDKARAKHNKDMSSVRDTMVHFRDKYKKKLTILEENSLEQMNKERITHSQAIESLERQLTESRAQLEQLMRSSQLHPQGANAIASLKNNAPDVSTQTAPFAVDQRESKSVVSAGIVPEKSTADEHTHKIAERVHYSPDIEVALNSNATPQVKDSGQSIQATTDYDSQELKSATVPQTVEKGSSDHSGLDGDNLSTTGTEPHTIAPKDSVDITMLNNQGHKATNDQLEDAANSELEDVTIDDKLVDTTVNENPTEEVMDAIASKETAEIKSEINATIEAETIVDHTLSDETHEVGDTSMETPSEETQHKHSLVSEGPEEEKELEKEASELNNLDQPTGEGESQEKQVAAVTSSKASSHSTKPEAISTTLALQKVDPKLQQEYKKLKAQVAELKRQHQTDLQKLKTLENEATRGGHKGAESSVEDKRELKKREKELKEAQKQFELAKNNLSKIQSQLNSTEIELTSLKKDHDKLLEETKSKDAELKKLSTAAKDGAAAREKVDKLQETVKQQIEEIQKLATSFNSERLLRKKYYNMIEDMKGKIRVYCRVRPLSSSEKERKDQSVIDSPDEYSVHVRTTRATKEYQFDQVFTPEHSQERVFEDTKNLIQSAVDGYNVCIFAYGQTGSGKTYTMIGGKDSKGALTSPGIAPRAFDEIYNILDANRNKFSFSVACYILELYNDRLIDLFNPKGKEPAKLDIKKDKKGMVVVQGSIIHPAGSAEELMGLFELGSKNRHVSSTKMNAESSRSHLIIGVIIESTNKTNGSVHKGKLSVVDLAGSERAAKTGASAEQLKEAQSINKSLSALGDVISALSSGQDFVPYRNNRLTLLMQDSLGGNAKTLMFVNISPADYNADETVTSLTYAARVKLISNDASKNAENKEITRLKGIIAKLKKGEDVAEDDLEL